MIKSIVVASALAATVATSASAATISTDKDTCNNKQNGCHVITIQGDIQYGDDQKFDGELSRHPDLKVGVVALNSNGGNLDAALKIGRTIRKKNFATVAQEKCYSACAIIWVAGTYLQAYKASNIGFHSAATTTAQKGKKVEVQSSSGNALIGAYFNELGLSEKAIAFMTSASPDQITRLTKHAAINLGIKVVFLDETEAEAKCFERADALVEKSNWIPVGSTWNLDMKNNRCLVKVLTPKGQPKTTLSFVDAESGKVLAQITATKNNAQCQYNGSKPVACTLESFLKQSEKL